MLEHNYYVYYDPKTGEILSVSNEVSDRHKAGISVDFDEIHGFLNGKMRLFDYKVGYKKLPNKSVVLGIVHKDTQGYSFKNNVFEWIREENKEAECQVEWNNEIKNWKISLSDSFKRYNNIVLEYNINFFIILQDDFDFLIRTIDVRFQDLLDQEYVFVPFTSNIESQIDKIAVASRMVFRSYGLKKIYE